MLKLDAELISSSENLDTIHSSAFTSATPSTSSPVANSRDHLIARLKSDPVAKYLYDDNHMTFLRRCVRWTLANGKDYAYFKQLADSFNLGVIFPNVDLKALKVDELFEKLANQFQKKGGGSQKPGFLQFVFDYE